MKLKNISRRAFIRGFAQASLLGLGALALPGCELMQSFGGQDHTGIGLGPVARRIGRQYGAAVQSSQLDDEGFSLALQREVSMLVPENELKWDVLCPSQDSFNFGGYHKLAAFAEANDMRMRGHTLLWHYANPRWLKNALKKKGSGERILETHIKRVLGETSGMIRNWDVVNEAVDPRSKRDDGLRSTIWLDALGPDYVATAFRMANKADSGLTLVYNDFGMERGDSDGRFKRQCILRLLAKCVIQKVPVHGLGLQSHLQAHRPLAHDEFGVFLREVRDMGLKIYVTEMDLDVSKLSGSMDDRVALAQNYVAAYLDLIQDGGAIDMLLTWGLSDRYSWLKEKQPNLSGALPLDRELSRGPLWDTLKTAWLKS